MRISDWSSDVCSSDLPLLQRLLLGLRAHPRQVLDAQLQRVAEVADQLLHLGLGFRRECDLDVQLAHRLADLAVDGLEHALAALLDLLLAAEHLAVERSAEHTSDLPSLMCH